MDQHRHLSTPLRLGPVTVANRIVFAAQVHRIGDSVTSRRASAATVEGERLETAL
ncbi:hypothetical protein SAMN05661080_03099 [Modestobacter sp. DSM 44400]|uniref:hypothetical protein n=1 Tax=Modestobacter sp. DSM 44400 TaxID=1550230 RepID=UPI000898D03D|nr:hypothetical protein [Modestobacter sp. DSM 44400]SDY32856.1 hypothetical protein SAMN05661080_03099 [Modestobacter sp. DSM 44400]